MFVRNALFSATLLLFAMPLVAQAQDAETSTVYVLEGTKGTISVKDTARIEAGGIAGTSVEATIEGPAKLKRANVVTMVDGQIPVGVTKVELNVHPTGPGTVLLKVTTKSPTSPEPEVKTIKITVK